MTLFANPAGLSCWAPARTATGRSRHDYDHPDHLLSEMMTEEYFGTVLEELASGDIVHITDAVREQQIIRIEWTDRKARKVGFSLQERVIERAVVGTDGLAVKWKGPRGGYWCVIDGDGNVVSKDHKSRDEADRARDTAKAKAA